MLSLLLFERLTVVLLLTWAYVSWRRSQQNRNPLPPGPRRWPIIGSMAAMPREKEWLTFTEWQKLYGDIVSLSIFGRSIIVLNSAKVAFDLLHKRSSIYSDRPYLAMGGDLVGWDHALGLTPYGDRLRQMRRLMHQVLSPRPAQAFWSAEEKETALFLNRLLKSPDQFEDHIRHTAGAIILKISHGYTVSETGKDPLVSIAEKTMEEFSLSTAPGAFLVDFLPRLKHIPKWLPGTGFLRTASQWRKDLFHMADVAYQFTKDQMAKGKALPSFTSELLKKEPAPEEESVVKWTGLSIYGGGTDTTVTAVMNFFLALCLYPHVQFTAQEELDRVIGGGRLPTVADRPSLPYINAIVREVTRWGAVVPGAVPHRLMQEDEYKGYRIPAGSLIIANIWGMMHDPDIYPEPHEFRPERFIGANSSDPEADPFQVVFGFGRRICPGQHVAEPSLFLSIAMTLAAFNISKARDEVSGEVIEPVAEWLPGTISHPKPFRCEIKPRSSKAVELIKQAAADHNKQAT